MKINHLQMKPLLLPKKMIKIMRWAIIKGELSMMKMGMIKKSQNHHHSLIQELGKPFNMTIWSTTFLVP
jgi:hypothetical protein